MSGHVEETVLALLREKGLTFSAAESCTGGLIAKRFTDLPGASAVFTGGVVSYTNAVKAGVLGVAPALLEKYGAVSAPVAQAMAEGVRRITGSDAAVSATGVAGPDSDERSNPVGLVYLGYADQRGAVAVKCRFSGTREDIRAAAADRAFALLAEHLSGEEL